jgi:DNA polymerase III gamma/tau subunit
MQWALYRKWRPQTFLEVCGQEHITSVLQYEVAQNKTTHAYLFCGSRGTGKTTCAKILAKAVNCLSPVDGNPCGKPSARKNSLQAPENTWPILSGKVLRGIPEAAIP